jgi:hypothetical protein
MFVDPCIIVQFIQKNPTRYNSVSKFIIPYLYDKIETNEMGRACGAYGGG